jgi:hypothetical protein
MKSRIKKMKSKKAKMFLETNSNKGSKSPNASNSKKNL